MESWSLNFLSRPGLDLQRSTHHFPTLRDHTKFFKEAFFHRFAFCVGKLHFPTRVGKHPTLFSSLSAQLKPTWRCSDMIPLRYWSPENTFRTFFVVDSKSRCRKMSESVGKSLNADISKMDSMTLFFLL